MSRKVVEIESPFCCPHRGGMHYPDMLYTEWVVKGRPSVNYMWKCGLKKGIVCSNPNTFCEACMLEEMP